VRLPSRLPISGKRGTLLETTARANQHYVCHGGQVSSAPGSVALLEATPAEVLASICDQNLAVYRASPIRLREDVGQEAEIAHDYRGRIVYELLQNADDAMAANPSHQDSIWFRLTDTDLWVGNSGRPLDADDVRGLCGIGASSKGGVVDRRRASIGHKGMGFKSVLEITEAPEVISETYAFRLGRHLAAAPVAALMTELGQPQPKRVPAMRFPAALADLPSEWHAAQDRRVRTLFRFPLRTDSGESERAQLADRLLALPVTAILFLRHLEHIEVEVQTTGRSENFAWSVTREQRHGSRWLPTTGLSDTGIYRVTVDTNRHDPRHFIVAHNNDLEVGANRAGLDEYAWAGIDLSEVSVAAELVDGRPVAVPRESQVIHVFLPTGESCPYPIVINGAFSADLSRQEVRVASDAHDYNRWLLTAATKEFCEALVPALYDLGAGERDVLGLLDRHASIPGEPAATATGEVIVQAMRAALASSPLISLPTGERVRLTSCIVPPLVEDKEAGLLFRHLLTETATHAALAFPAAELCAGRSAHVAVDHGACELELSAAPMVLASHDPLAAELEPHESGGIYVDPVLRVLERLWNGMPSSARPEFEAAVRAAPLFPVDTDRPGVVARVAVADRDCFYPPRALSGSIPLDELCFLSRDICWGTLIPKVRLERLHAQLAAWHAMFEVREFKFPDVMRSSVLPALTLADDGNHSEGWSALCEPEILAAVCQLSGRTPNPAAPLPYERLGSNRALFNLARLPVPCRSLNEGEFDWQPAYRVYLGIDWIGDASVEHILLAVTAAGGTPPDVPILAAPEHLLPLLERYKHLRDAADEPEEVDEEDPDEVKDDEDEDKALDSTDHERWITFLTWLGVNRALRPTHFTDVEDRNAGWLTTKDLSRPRGRAFGRLRDELWTSYVADVRVELTRRGTSLSDSTAYFYQLHDLEYLSVFVTAAETDAECVVAKVLLRHLVENWPQLQRFSKAEIAAVPQDRVPSMRTKPQRAQDDERVIASENFWLWRLRQRKFCPTTHGPKAPADAWIRSLELTRRFSSKRGQLDAGQLLPVLDIEQSVMQRARPVLVALGVREEITPSSLRPADAETILRRLAECYGDHTPTRRDVREAIRPTYRALLELLPGQDAGESFPPGVLRNAPLLEGDGRDAYRFARADQVLWAERSGTRERLGNPTDLWTFVLDAGAGARVPLTRLFGTGVLEDELHWQPEPGESALDDVESELFQNGVQDLAPYLLARLRVDREALHDRDVSTLKRLMRSLQPVQYLRVGCRLGDRPLTGSASRAAFVDGAAVGEDLHAFVVWGEAGWPPNPTEAEALATAFAEGLGATHFEAFLALASASDAGARSRILSLAGADTDIEAERLALGEESDPSVDEIVEHVTLPRERAPVTDDGLEPEYLPAELVAPGHPEPMSPLYDVRDLLWDGTPVVVPGEPGNAARSSVRERLAGHTGDGSGHTSYGGRTDLSALDRLGMSIAMQYELRRLQREGVSPAAIFDPERQEEQPHACVFDVSAPSTIAAAYHGSSRFRDALAFLCAHGVDRAHPGCDILSVHLGSSDPVDRLIELKSSGQHARTQAMTWNEWKTAQSETLRSRFYLYLVANLRSDLPDARPFIRAIRDPFGTMRAQEEIDHTPTRRVTLHVSEFESAEHLDLEVRSTAPPPAAAAA
jgi:Domain of unknown function (DUF3883)